jgi:TolB-like protein
MYFSAFEAKPHDVRMKIDNFFAELKRRNVYKVAVAYAVVGWVIAQVATQIFPFLEIPNWIVRLVIVLIAIGFPIALVIAWAFEATPEGIKRTEVADAMPMATGQKKHAWIYVVVIGAAVSVALFFLGRYTARNIAGASNRELPPKSIAVLPFENLSDDKSNAYFTEGIQEEILTRLSKIADLKVISRTSTQKFKSAPTDLSEIAKQLGVANILEGSVQKASDQVRISVQLINALNDSHLWAETYDRKMIDMFGVESDVAQKIAGSLEAKLTGKEKAAVEERGTSNSQAYETYLHAIALRDAQADADQIRHREYNIARQTLDLLSPEKDAVLGSGNLAALAEIQAQTGAATEAVQNLRKLLSMPAGETISIARLKIDPVWDPIRNDSGFRELLGGKELVGPNK